MTATETISAAIGAGRQQPVQWTPVPPCRHYRSWCVRRSTGTSTEWLTSPSGARKLFRSEASAQAAAVYANAAGSAA